jgi:transcriptional regulator with GAF, ATPase, and Fis domain
LSARREEPFVCFNCATIPDTLVESELFGYERGAFTNAVTAKQGLIESATGGTLFLDEVAELPAATQAKLLRVLENKRLRPLGEVRERPVDVRVVTATNRDIEEDVRAGRFRKDLYFRLRGAALWIPPLRERRGEIVLLARAFLDRACARLGRGALEISAEAIAEMEAYAWPGNVRELQSFIDYTAAIAKGDVLERGSLAHWLGELAPPSPRAAAAPGPTARAFRPLKEELRDLERERIADALAATGGNQTRAAELLKMPIRTLLSKVKTYGLVAGSKTKR